MNKIPAGSTAWLVYESILDNLGAFFARAWIPMLITFAVVFGWAYYSIQHTAGSGGKPEWALPDENNWQSYAETIAWLLGIVLLNVPFCVSWIRFVLNEERKFEIKHLIFRRRHAQFLLYTAIAIGATYLPIYTAFRLYLAKFGPFSVHIPSGILTIVSIVIATTAWLILNALLLRLSLPATAAAIGSHVPYSTSWRKTSGNTLRLAILQVWLALPIIIVALLFAVTVMPLVAIAMRDIFAGGSVMEALIVMGILGIGINIALNYLGLALLGSAIALTYRHFTTATNPAPDAQTQTA